MLREGEQEFYSYAYALREYMISGSFNVFSNLYCISMHAWLAKAIEQRIRQTKESFSQCTLGNSIVVCSTKRVVTTYWTIAFFLCTVRTSELYNGVRACVEERREDVIAPLWPPLALSLFLYIYFRLSLWTALYLTFL